MSPYSPLPHLGWLSPDRTWGCSRAARIHFRTQDHPPSPLGLPLFCTSIPFLTKQRTSAGRREMTLEHPAGDMESKTPCKQRRGWWPRKVHISQAHAGSCGEHGTQVGLLGRRFPRPGVSLPGALVPGRAPSKHSTNVSRQHFDLFISKASLVCFHRSLMSMQCDISFRCPNSTFINCLSTSLCPLSQEVREEYGKCPQQDLMFTTGLSLDPNHKPEGTGPETVSWCEGWGHEAQRGLLASQRPAGPELDSSPHSVPTWRVPEGPGPL